jgi:hypothetical protein
MDPLPTNVVRYCKISDDYMSHHINYRTVYVYSPSLVGGEGKGDITLSLCTMPMHILVYINQNVDKEFSAALVSE